MKEFALCKSQPLRVIVRALPFSPSVRAFASPIVV